MYIYHYIPLYTMIIIWPLSSVPLATEKQAAAHAFCGKENNTRKNLGS